MVHAIRFETTGGPEVLTYQHVSLPPPLPQEVQVRHHAIGVNFIDIYHRTGLYPVPLPSGLGLEAAGVVEACGSQVSNLQPGDHVAYATGPLGAYSQVQNVPASRVVKLPTHMPFDIVAASLLKGMTAEYLLRRTFHVKPGDTILFHAAAGGVGQIACQWAKALGATVIGTVGDPAKRDLALRYGCDHVIVSRDNNMVEIVRQLTDGRGVPVVFDSIGKDTFITSLDCLSPFGTLVSFGNASGPVPPVDLGILAQKGSLFVTRPTLMTYTATPEMLQASANAFFDIVGSNKVKINHPQAFALDEAAEAHRALESRKTTGSLILKPD